MTTRILSLLLSLPLAALSLTACDDDEGGGGGGTVCEQAADIFVNECGAEVAGGSGGEAAACEGVAEAVSQCVVDFPSEACDALEDPVGNADNAYSMCAIEAAGG